MTTKKMSKAVQIHAEKMAALKALEDRKGRITPKRLVESARPVDNVWHNSFEWNNDKAAEKWRIRTAREILATWVAPQVVGETVERRSVVYVRDPRLPTNESGYVSIAKVRTDEDLKREVLLMEFERAGSALQRAYDVADLLNARSEVQALIKKVDKLRKRAEDISLGQ